MKFRRRWTRCPSGDISADDVSHGSRDHLRSAVPREDALSTHAGVRRRLVHVRVLILVVVDRVPHVNPPSEQTLDAYRDRADVDRHDQRSGLKVGGCLTKGRSRHAAAEALASSSASDSVDSRDPGGSTLVCRAKAHNTASGAWDRGDG